ncbi:MAG: hypothetical protein ACO32T_06095 [Candidatus Nanopelagicaceae bacterium]
MAQWWLIGSVLGRHTSTNGAPLTPTRFLTMETVTITNNGATIQMTGTYPEIANFLIGLSQATAQQSAPVVNTEPAELVPFKDVVLAELTPHLGAQLSKKVVDLLEYCRKGYTDFGPFVAAYRWVGNDIQKRQLLKTVSAIYRYKFTPKEYTNSYQYSLRSEIKYATICPHCGSIASTLVDRLKSEGLWK